ncbi:ABC transporter ATP-binding protein [Laribacter hongkongensis]|uniref:ABC transporter ATP-binding protein n=1 Tax=Laribacter hongkongensis TaxID=168471 RepID=UPI001EFE9109|nr:ABC transporter ATP-binding protein [Laribacter hongkongensis]MCG9040715.1 ABC transporter ATP-binding protein/permease [Laribacter hongkongensis]MCG9056249.1 ABC transporter ATP-binding protein/permease [Laribacter hongkongensis]MCG9067871.1 ABC transporter ATP-binding protein/permease [Laribacter hongkongensis]
MLLIAASVAEMASIGAVLPFLGAMLEPERLIQKPFLQPIIHIFGIVKPSELLMPLTALFCAVVVVSSFLRLSLLRAQTKLSHDVGADISLGIYQRTLYQPYIKHLMRNSSELISGITTKANNVVHLALLPAFGILTSGVMLISILVVLIFVDWKVALACLLGLSIIYLGVIWLVKQQLAIASKQISVESTRVIKVLQEGFGGIRDVLIDGSQESYCRLYKSSDTPLRKAYADVAIITSAPRFGIEALAMVVIALFAYFQVGQSQGLVGAIPVIGAFALGAQRMLPVIQQGYSAWSSIKGFQYSLEDALELLELPLPERLVSSHALSFKHSIKLERLGFRYLDDSPFVLKELTLEITKGSQVGIIGTTGSGKSTLLDVVMGLLQPTTGGLFVDEVRIDDSNSHLWQMHISHVPQAIYLSDATVAENIAFGLHPSEIDLPRVQRAAHLAQIGQDIELMDQKYQTLVGERGVRLSGGQRQRIGIARALYKQSDVIVLDEATSALDENTEAAVMRSIDQLNNTATVLIIAHRKSTLKNCDMIIEVRDGQVIFVGTYNDLMLT